MIQRFLGIQPGERKNIFLLALLGFCWSMASSTGVAFSDALFLETVGSKALSSTFAFTALGLFCVSGIFIYLYNRYSVNEIFYKSLSIGIGFYILTFTLLLFNITPPFFIIAFKTFAYVFHVAFVSLFFTFLDQFFELQNAKRIFSLLYSPIFLGMAVSGAILPLCVTKLGIFIMLMLGITSLISAIVLLKYIPKVVEVIPDHHQEFAVVRTSKRDLVRAIIRSPFTLLFLLGSLLLHAILVFTEFQYMNNLEMIFQTEGRASFTGFLAKLYFWGSLFNIFFGIFIYSRLVRRLGLNNIILVVPLFFSTLFFGWLFSSHIFLPIMGFIAVEGVLNLLEDNNFNLLLNAVPLKLKNKIRITCESILEPLGLLLSSVLLMAFQAQSKIIGLSLSAVFLILTCFLRAYYAKGIFYNLISHLIPFHQKNLSLNQKVTKREFRQSKSLFLTQFYDMKVHEQLFVIETALKFHDLNLLELLLKKMTKLHWSVKLKTLEIFEDYPSSITVQYLPYFQFWMKQSPHLQNDLFFLLSKLKLLDIGIAQNYLHHPNAKIRAACLLTVRQKHRRSFESKQARRLLYELLVSKNEEDNLVGIQVLKYERLKDFKSKVFDLLNAASIKLKEQILKTLPYLLESHDTQYVPYLLRSLQDKNYEGLKILLLEALEKIIDPFHIKELLVRSSNFTFQEQRCLHSLILQLGQDAIYELESIYKNIYLPDRIRLTAAQIIGKLSRRHLKAFFTKMIDHEIERAYFLYYHLCTFDKRASLVNTHLLKSALQNSLDSVLSFIIQTLALLGRFENGEHLLKSLNSKHPKTFSHAYETLEKMCSTKLFKQLTSLISPEDQEAFIKSYHQLNLPVLTLDNLLDYLEQTPSYLNQCLVPRLREQYQLFEAHSRKNQSKEVPRLDHFTVKFLEVC